MSEARRQILHLLADRRISASDAELLLAAWAQGYPEEAAREPAAAVLPNAWRAEVDSFPEYDRPAPSDSRDSRPDRVAHSTIQRMELTSPSTPTPPSRLAPQQEPLPEVEESLLDLDATLPEFEEVFQDATASPPSATQPSEEWDARATEGIPIPPDGVIRIRARDLDSGAREDSLTSIAVRGVETDKITIVRGVGVRVRRTGKETQLSWGVGLLLLEIPTSLGSLEFESIPGSLGLSGYLGPFTVDGLAGPLTVHGPKSAFRVRNVRGLVRVLGLALRDGISTIAQSDGDVEIEVAEEASVSIRAVSTEGGVSLGESPGEAESSAFRRRGVWRLGAGAAQLNVSTIRGKISLRRIPGTEKGKPS